MAEAPFNNPLISSVKTSPDPYIIRHKGFYYYCLSDSANTQIWIWRSPTLAGLDTTKDKKMIWQAPARGAYSKNVWAPEMHFINGNWYIYFTADNGHNENHRLYVLKSNKSDAFGKYHQPHKLQWKSEDYWAIDGTVFRNNDDSELYLVWSGWPGKGDGRQNLYIAPMASPIKLKGPRQLLAEPEYGWEGWINEGPSILQRNGRIYISYSAHESWSSEYCLGLLYTESSSNLLNRSCWKKQPYPILKAEQNAGIYGPGHNSFFEGPDGADWIAYHAKTIAEKGWEDRKAFVHPLSWDVYNLPFIGSSSSSFSLV